MGKRYGEKVDPQVTRFTPSTEQKELVRSIWNHSITLVSGCAGTGKTLLSIQTLLELLKQHHLEKIVVVRLITDTCDEHLGALPGEKEDKLSPFLGPVLDNLQQILTPTELEYLLSKGKLEVIPVSHARGRTFIRCGVIVEEAQNLSDGMVLTLLTRLGEGSRMVINGDPDQVDLRGRNGIAYAHRLLEGLDDVGVVEFSTDQIQRHPLLKLILARAKQLRDSELARTIGAGISPPTQLQVL